MDEAVKTFREIAKNPSIVGSHLHRTNDNGCTISTVWSQRDLERGESVKFSTTHLVSGDFQRVTQIPGASTELKDELFCRWSPSRQLKAVVRQVKNKKGDDKQYLEIWSLFKKEQSIDLDALDKHGKVYDDDRFGCLEWSASEKQLVYVAEKKQPKKTSYFDPKKSDAEDVCKGAENEFLESWGERLTTRHHPVICIMDLETESVKIVEGIDKDISPGQASWAPDDSGIVFIGITHSPYRLGAHVCFNRTSAIFFANLKSTSSQVILLSGFDKHIRSLRFSPDRSKFVYLCNAAGGPHWHCSQIALYDWTKQETTVVVDTVMTPGANEFPGVYCIKLPTTCWSDDNKRIFLTTHWRSKQEIISVNTSTKAVTRVTNNPDFGSWTILDMYDGKILATRSSPCSPHHLVVGKVPSEGQEATISWLCVDSKPLIYDEIKWEILVYQPKSTEPQQGAGDIDYECILIKPSQTGDKKTPLIVYPHGGPHCAMAAEFATSCAFFCKMGFAVLMVNYRGSLGFGQAGVLSLLGNVGTQDVLDCHMAAQTVLARDDMDENKAVLMGGSHGGFLVTHLIGQYPGFYKACTTRNPVTNIASMLGSTDIPDWAYTEAGLEFKPEMVPSAHTYEAMLMKSPIVHVDKVKTPVMLMIGEDDRRVPPKQGYEYYKAIKARGVDTKLYTYPDNNHSLSKVDCEGDCLMNMYKWFTTYV